MPIQDIWGFTLHGFGTLTVYTPSNVVVQGAISIADFIGAGGAGVNFEGGAYIQQINIPGYGELEFNGLETTVRWELNSITFAAIVTSTILVAIYSE